MKKVTTILGISLLIVSQHAVCAETVKLNTQNDKLSYTIGYDLGKDFKDRGVVLDSQLLRQGMLDAQQGGQRALTEEQMQTALLSFQKDMLEKQAQQVKQQSIKNKQTGLAFLAKNKQKPGVQSLKDGIQYKILKEGHGSKPKATDSVTVKYEGRTIDGNVFDKSPESVTFNLSEVIPGWTEVLQLMPTGSTWEVYIPPEHAYGERGVPHGPIGPNQTLIFTITLEAIAKTPVTKS